MCKICCEFFIFQRNNGSAQWASTASVSVSPIWDFWNGRHPRLFDETCGSNAQKLTQWTTQFAQKFSSGPASEKFTMWTERHYDMAGMALSNASPRVVQTSLSKRTTFLVFNLTADSTFVYSNVLVWWKLQVRWYYWVEYVRILPFFYIFALTY